MAVLLSPLGLGAMRAAETGAGRALHEVGLDGDDAADDIRDLRSLFECMRLAKRMTDCATGGSEPRIVTVCPPVVEYTRELQARAAGDLGTFPDGSVIAEMLADYSVMRDQARACDRL